MNEELKEIIEIIEMLLEEDLSFKLKAELESISVDLKSCQNISDMIRVREDLESFLEKIPSGDFVATQIRDVIYMLDTLN
ncbi:MAG: hypothetical protein ACOCXG_02310 [Nanoarchaeota archaeon]